jgi:type II secretory pathway component PulF
MATAHARFYDNLAELLEAGLPVGEALATAAGRERSAGPAARLAAAVREGGGLAERAAGDPFFGELDTVLLGVGEASGTLPEQLRTLAEWHRQNARLRRRLLLGLLYPALLLHAAAVLSMVPGLVLGEISAAQFLLGVLVRLTPLYVPAALVLAAARARRRWAGLGRLYDAVAIRIPVLGGAVRAGALSRFCRAAAALVQAGFGLDEAIRAGRRACQQRTVAARLAGGEAAVRRGEPASRGFDPRLPAAFLATWKSGEASGQLVEGLRRLAGTYAEEADRRLLAACVALSVLALLVAAGLIAWKVIAFWAGYAERLQGVTP